MSSHIYGSVSDADLYFTQRLHQYAWSNSDPEDHEKALLAATRVIDNLSFKGVKSSVYTLLSQNSDATDSQIREANAAQELEFPRGSDDEIPEAIIRACYEIAYSLLDGKDPELELENLAITSHGFSSARTTYNRNQPPLEHLINGVPSVMAWMLLKPFLRDDDLIILRRV